MPCSHPHLQSLALRESSRTALRVSTWGSFDSTIFRDTCERLWVIRFFFRNPPAFRRPEGKKSKKKPPAFQLHGGCPPASLHHRLPQTRTRTSPQVFPFLGPMDQPQSTTSEEPVAVPLGKWEKGPKKHQKTKGLFCRELISPYGLTSCW